MKENETNLIWTNVTDISYNNEVILQIIYPPDNIYLYFVDDTSIPLDVLLDKLK